MKFYHGLDLQLPIYMLAIKNAAENLNLDDVIGAFYMTISSTNETKSFAELEKVSEKITKPRGLFNGDFYQALDNNIRHGQRSRFYNFAVTKKDQQYGYPNYSNALKPEDFSKVIKIAKTIIIDMAKDLIAGDFNIMPYKRGTTSACAFCDYQTLCKFDWQINAYKFLQSKSKKDLMEQ